MASWPFRSELARSEFAVLRFVADEGAIAACHGQRPFTSTSSDQLRNVRTTTISPSTPTL